MKMKFLLTCSIFIMMLVMAACRGQPPSTPVVVVETVETELNPTAVETVLVEDYDSLWKALQTAGATVEVGEGIAQDFFTVSGQLIKVNGNFVQIYEFETADAMNTNASQVSENGSSIGTNMVTWIEPPHFYKLGRMIVLYVGQDQTILDLLDELLGPQFAGQ